MTDRFGASVLKNEQFVLFFGGLMEGCGPWVAMKL